MSIPVIVLHSKVLNFADLHNRFAPSKIKALVFLDGKPVPGRLDKYPGLCDTSEFKADSFLCVGRWLSSATKDAIHVDVDGKTTAEWIAEIKAHPTIRSTVPQALTMD